MAAVKTCILAGQKNYKKMHLMKCKVAREGREGKVLQHIYTQKCIPYHLALHCLADLRCRSEAILDHWFLPYFMTAALRISS